MRLIQDENNMTRVLITLYIGGSPFFTALLDYYEAFNKDPNQLILQAAISCSFPLFSMFLSCPDDLLLTDS